MKSLKIFFMITDLGFILYWAISILEILPESYLFKDYYNPIVMAWNWSFFPLDMLISLTGLMSLYLYKRNHPLWSKLAGLSLVFTFCSGFMAISFWIFKWEFDLVFWILNIYLMIYPLFFLKGFLKK
ncbi:MAG: YvaD family protein [Clostridia bacterium]|nr:YvaD family protein [Clostridia bacterium]